MERDYEFGKNFFKFLKNLKLLMPGLFIQKYLAIIKAL